LNLYVDSPLEPTERFVVPLLEIQSDNIVIDLDGLHDRLVQLLQVTIECLYELLSLVSLLLIHAVAPPVVELMFL
jgi:hypothetical protein